jgi:hypothetical protein
MTINPKLYGARGDGRTNDTPAFLRALEALRAAGGGTLRMPAGKYLLEKSDDGYAREEYEVTTNSALVVDFGNLVLQGDGMGLTVLEAASPTTTLLLVSGPDLRNICLRDLTFEQPDAAADYANTQTARTLRASERPSVRASERAGAFSEPRSDAPTLRRSDAAPDALNYIDQGWTLGTMIYLEGRAGQAISNISITRCELRNPVRHAICLAWAKNVRITDNLFAYYDGFIPPQYSGHASGAGRCGIFGGAPSVHDVLISGNNFNGNVSGKCPVGSSATGYAYCAADGFVWLSRGGGVNVENNTIRNYGLEAIQLSAAPARVQNNQFYTETDTPGAVACYAYPCSPREDDIERPLFTFSGNQVYGGGGGLWTKGPALVYTSELPTPRCRLMATGNIFEKVDVVFAALSADAFVCSNNVASDCRQFVCYNIGPLDEMHPRLDFRCRYLSFIGNIINRCTDVPLLFNGTLADAGVLVLIGNTVARGNYHLVLGYPKEGETYTVVAKDNVWVAPDGKLEAAPAIAYTPLPASIKFSHE